jgi:ketosteroid isomerase-like protein
MGQREIDFVHQGYDALNRRDEAAIGDLLDPGVVLETTVETFHGVAGVLEFLRRADEIIEGYSIAVEEIIDAGERIVAVTRQSGRGRTSGAIIDQTTTHVWTVREGRGVAMKAFTDRAAALEAVGRASG